MLVSVSEALLSETATDKVALWRERALRVEERLARATARIDALSEQVATLSRMLFGQSSEQAEQRMRTRRAGGPALTGKATARRAVHAVSNRAVVAMAAGTTRIWTPRRSCWTFRLVSAVAPVAGSSSNTSVRRPATRSTGE